LNNLRKKSDYSTKCINLVFGIEDGGGGEGIFEFKLGRQD